MKKILVVEDDVDIHLLIKDILEKERYKVISAYSGTEAILLIEKNDIDLILLDLMLPGLLGEEIIKKVKNIPIIVIGTFRPGKVTSTNTACTFYPTSVYMLN